MSWFKKLATAVRGGINEAGEAAADSQALRILDQEIRDAENHLGKAKGSLTSVMAEKMASERKVSDLKKSIVEYEGYVEQALGKGDEALALEIADKIAELENELSPMETVLTSQVESVNNLKRTIKQTENRLNATKREVSIIKSTESVQQAQAAVAAKHSGSESAMTSAMGSLERIKARQQKQADKMRAAQELSDEGSGSDLKSKMQAAGIVDGSTSGNAVLDRLRAKKKAG